MFSRLLNLGSCAPEGVWFSRDIKHNQLRNWIIVAKGHRLEFRRQLDGTFVLHYQHERGWTPERERDKPDRVNRGHYGQGIDSWLLIPVGDTRMRDSEATRAVNEARQTHEGRRMSWADVQSFCLRFAEFVVDDRDPNYWPFFAANMASARIRVGMLPPPPRPLVEDHARRLHAARNSGQGRSANAIAERSNAWQASFLAAQQQNILTNNYLMQQQ